MTEPSLSEQLRGEVDHLVGFPDHIAIVIRIGEVRAAADRLEKLEAVVEAQESYMASQRIGRMASVTIDRLSAAKAALAALDADPKENTDV